MPLLILRERGKHSVASRHNEREELEENAGDLPVPAAVLAALHAVQAEQVLADGAGERVAGAVGARALQAGQDDLARRRRRRQDVLGQQVRPSLLSYKL